MSWMWNYFTLKGMCKASCNLCDHHERPRIRNQESLHRHICICDGTNDHKKANEEIEKFKKNYSKIDWDKYYNIVEPTDNMFNPKIECNVCGHQMSTQGRSEIRKERFLSSTTQMKSHLKEKHEVDEDTWMSFYWWLHGKTDYYDRTKLRKMEVYICNACNNHNNESRFNAIMFVKHMIDKHQEEFKEFFCWDKIPKELHPSPPRYENVDINLQASSLTRNSSVISTDRSRQRESISEIRRLYSNPPFDTRDILNISQDSQQQYNMANVLDEDLQTEDMRAPSIQLFSDPKVIPSIRSRKRKNDTQIEEPPNKRKKSNVELIKKFHDEIFNLTYKRNKIIQKLMSKSKKTIFTLNQEIKKILEEMSEDAS